jgi:hypothetical protein
MVFLRNKVNEKKKKVKKAEAKNAFSRVKTERSVFL